jgi:hypothetical protein
MFADHNFYETIDNFEDVANDITNGLEEDYPGSGPCSKAVCPLSEPEMAIFRANVQPVTDNDGTDACIERVNRAIEHIHKIVANR